MASVGTLSVFYPVFLPASIVATAYGVGKARSVDWRRVLKHFLTSPGRTSRLLLLLFVATNWKSLPFGWTIRIFHAFVYHVVLRRRFPALPPRALFHYAITSSRTSLLETDYNLHKSNSTYFADLDVSRSHLVSHLLGPAIPRIADNANTKLVHDRHGAVIKGSFGIVLGGVYCNFRREVSPFQAYEMWSRILAWDRKWLYIVTHFVAKDKVRPTDREAKQMGPTRPRPVPAGEGKVESMDKYILATGISKYVFKLASFTVHPTVLMEASGLLPERPGGGWRGGEQDVGITEELENPEESKKPDTLDDGVVWDWRRVERERRKGLDLAQHFMALDHAHALFAGGGKSAVGRFPLG